MSEAASNEFRIGKLEGKVEQINGDVNDILRKELPAIRIQVATLSTSIKIFGGLILTGISALIVMGLAP